MRTKKINANLLFVVTLICVLFLGLPVAAQSLQSVSSVLINDTTANGPVLANNDQYGTAVASLGDLNGDSVVDIAVGTNEVSTSKGKVHIHFLNSDGSVKSTIEINDTTANGPSLSAGDRYGSAIANMGDLDGDGIIDIAVGAAGADGGGTNEGKIFIHFLDTNGTVKKTISFDSGSTDGPSLNQDDEYGSSIANLGDLDTNGYNDMAVGSPKTDEGGTDRGIVHIHSMEMDGGEIKFKRTNELSYSTVDGATNLADKDEYGSAVANMGDLTGNGLNELGVGAQSSDFGGLMNSNKGTIYIHFLSLDGTNIVVDSTIQWGHGIDALSLANGDHYGSAIVSIGDLNNDSIAEIAVGAYKDDTDGESQGSIYINFMNESEGVDSTWKVNNSTTGNTFTTNPHDNFGRSLADIGDTNGDGMVEFAVGEPGDSDQGTKKGTVHIVGLKGTVFVAGIVWDGSSWSGGSSTLVSGGPSTAVSDSSKSMTIEAGDTAKILEEIRVRSLQVDSNAILEVTPSQCMTIRVSSVVVHDSASVVLTATSDSTYAQYHGAAMDNTTAEMVLEHYNWHQIASPVGGTTLSNLEAENSAGGDGYIVYAASHTIPLADTSHIRWYETQDYNGGTNIGFGADSSYSDAFGTWYGGKSTDVFDGTIGYMIFVNATLTQDTPLPLKLKITGTTNDSSRSTTTDTDNFGWTMVSNPYPTTIDWEVIEARVGSGTNDTSFHFLPTLSIWEPANQNYATYLADSVGTSGIAANDNGTGVELTEGMRYIAPFQSFWVQRLDHEGEDDGSSDPEIFKVIPTDRVICEQPKHFRLAAFDYAVMRVKLSSDDNHYTDELLLRFGRQFNDTYSSSKDAHKLSSPNPEVALISTKAGGKSLIIHSRSNPDERASIPIWTKAPLGVKLKVEITDKPEGWSAWLVEVATGNAFYMESGSFEFVNFTVENNHRFDLVIKNGPEEPNTISANVYTRDNGVEIEFHYPGVRKEVIVKDILGRVIYATTVVDQETIFLPFDTFAKQAYLIHVISNADSKLYKVIP